MTRSHLFQMATKQTTVIWVHSSTLDHLNTRMTQTQDL